MALREPRRLTALLKSIRSCRHCVTDADGAPLPHEPRPTLRVSSTARLLVAGQAPGNLVHQTGIPFNDPSGDRLRQWMGVDRETFYDTSRIAIVPMGFCFPGYDKSRGDLPPRRECRDKWLAQLFELAPQFDTVLAIGRYAQDYHLSRLGFARSAGDSVADVVGNWRSYTSRAPRVIPLPHPSWRNTGWLKRNPWFEAELLPALREEVARSISDRAPAARARTSRSVMLIRKNDGR